MASPRDILVNQLLPLKSQLTGFLLSHRSDYLKVTSSSASQELVQESKACYLKSSSYLIYPYRSYKSCTTLGASGVIIHIKIGKVTATVISQ